MGLEAYRVEVMNMTKLFLGVLALALALVISCAFKIGEPFPDLVEISEPSMPEIPKLKKAIPSGGNGACNFVSLNAGENILWQERLNGYDLCWTDKDLYVHHEGWVRSYFSEYADKWFRQVVLTDSPGGIYELTFCLQSAIDKTVTVEIEDFITGVDAANFAGRVSLITIDLSKSGPIALSYQEDKTSNNTSNSIINFFSEEAIFSALMNDSEVGDAIRKKGKETPNELQDLLSRNLRFERPNFTEVTFSGYSTDKFRFDYIEGDRVVVSLELLQAYAPRVGAIEFITISMPITGSNENAFMNAHEKKSGFMFRSAPELFGKSCTVVRQKT